MMLILQVHLKKQSTESKKKMLRKKDLEKYRDVDEDEILNKLTDDEIRALEGELEELDPDVSSTIYILIELFDLGLLNTVCAETSLQKIFFQDINSRISHIVIHNTCASRQATDHVQSH